MAKKSFRAKLITPEAQVLDQAVTYVSVPAWDGSIGFLPGRAPIVAKLGLGELRLELADAGTRTFLVEDGFAQMVGETLTILASKAIPAETLSEGEAQAELAEAEARRTDGDAAGAERVRRDRDRARAKVRLARAARPGR